MQSMHEFVARHGIGIEPPMRVPSNPNMADQEWARTAKHYAVTLTHGRKTMTLHFSQGSGIREEPTAADVLNALALDSSGFDNADGDFETWASEYGIEIDVNCRHMTPRRAESMGYDCAATYAAEATFKTVASQAKRLKTFLGAGLYAELLHETESL